MKGPHHNWFDHITSLMTPETNLESQTIDDRTAKSLFTVRNVVIGGSVLLLVAGGGVFAYMKTEATTPVMEAERPAPAVWADVREMNYQDETAPLNHLAAIGEENAEVANAKLAAKKQRIVQDATKHFDRIAALAAEKAERAATRAAQKAERKRVAAEEQAAARESRRVECERVAAEAESERQRIAAAEEAERQRIANEQAAEEAAERQRIAERVADMARLVQSATEITVRNIQLKEECQILKDACTAAAVSENLSDSERERIPSILEFSRYDFASSIRQDRENLVDFAAQIERTADREARHRNANQFFARVNSDYADILVFRDRVDSEMAYLRRRAAAAEEQRIAAEEQRIAAEQAASSSTDNVQDNAVVSAEEPTVADAADDNERIATEETAAPSVNLSKKRNRKKKKNKNKRPASETAANVPAEPALSPAEIAAANARQLEQEEEAIKAKKRIKAQKAAEKAASGLERQREHNRLQKAATLLRNTNNKMK